MKAIIIITIIIIIIIKADADAAGFEGRLYPDGTMVLPPPGSWAEVCVCVCVCVCARACV